MPEKYDQETLPLFNAIKLFLPGFDVTYYGSKIDMCNTRVRDEKKHDPNNAGATIGLMELKMVKEAQSNGTMIQ